MKSRGAIVATLIVSALLILLLTASFSKLKTERNEEILATLEDACALYTRMGSPEPGEGSFTALNEYFDAQDISFVLFDGEGETVFASEGADTSIAGDIYRTEDAIVHFIGEKSGVLYRAGSAGEGIILLSHASTGIMASYSGSGMMFVIFGMAALIFCMYEVVVASRRERAVYQVMTTLDSFSDGHFARRFDKRDGFDDESINAFNEVLDNINKRVFEQNSHNQALTQALNHAVNGVVTVDENMRVRFINATARKLLGITVPTVDVHVSDLSDNVRLDTVFINASAQGSGTYTTEIAAHTGTGRSRRVLRFFVSQIKKNDQPNGALALIEDITRIRDLEEARSDFAAAVSHELKTPLTSISGFVETLLESPLDDPKTAKKFLNIVKDQADRLRRLINDILTVSKLESGTEEKPRSLIDFGETINKVITTLNIQAKEKKVTVIYNKPTDKVLLYQNSDYMVQIVTNLVENAIKYNDKGENGKVNVRVIKDDAHAYMTVWDNGIGIPQESIGRLYEKFYRVDKGRSRAMGGTGLGLAITKEIIDEIGGNIEVTSKLNESTEFAVTLPLAPQSVIDSFADVKSKEDEYDLP